MSENETQKATEDQRIIEWRVSRLVRAGMDAEDALLIAEHWNGPDWRLAEALARRGVDHYTILRIVL